MSYDGPVDCSGTRTGYCKYCHERRICKIRQKWIKEGKQIGNEFF